MASKKLALLGWVASKKLALLELALEVQA